MLDQNFGTKELYDVTLKANNSVTFGERQIEKGEIVLAFSKVTLALLTQESTPIIARGGYGNMPRVIWEDRSAVTFSLSKGVLSNIGFGVLIGAKMLHNPEEQFVTIPKREGPFDLNGDLTYTLSQQPANAPAFCYEFARDTIQRKVEYTLNDNIITISDGNLANQYVFDYYYQYGHESLLYVIEKEQFAGTFLLEGKYYTKDETDGLNVTNIITMPRVRIVSSIDLRLGEKADPSVAVFNIIAMPENTKNSHYELMNILKLGEDIDGDF